MSPRERAHELASAFASGDLDAAGQAELLALLQDPVQGAEAGAEAWRAIDTAAGLRAVEPGAFISQVALRMGDDGKAVARAVAQRIGVPPPTLPPIVAPAPATPPTGRRWRLLAAGLAVAVAILLVLYLWPDPPPPPAVVERVSGVVRRDGAALLAGVPLGPGAITIPADAELVLRFRDGGSAGLRGPASVVIGGSQCAIAAGSAQVSGPLLIALPDGAVTLAPGDAVRLRAEDGAAIVAATAGSPRLAGSDGQNALPAGSARLLAGGSPWPVPGIGPWWSLQPPPVEPPGRVEVRWSDARLEHAEGRIRGSGRLAGLDRDLPWPVRIELRRRPAHLEVLADGISLGRWPGSWSLPESCFPAAEPVSAP